MRDPLKQSSPSLSDDALRFAQALWRHGEVHEVRILKCDRFGHTASGYFDCPEDLARAALPWDGKANVYMTLNPVNPALLARAANRIVRPAQQTTSDDEIARREWLYIDIDARRPAGISSTQEELAEAENLLNDVTKALAESGWPSPITCLSGNGYYALYPIDLPNSPQSQELVHRALQALAAGFNTSGATIDTTVANAARIGCLIGTLKMKGDSTEERPHRRSELLSLPDRSTAVPLELLEELGTTTSPPRSSNVANVTSASVRLPLMRLLNEAGIDYREQPRDARGTVWYHVRECPFHGANHPYECGVGQATDGIYLGKCFHPEGEGKGWPVWSDALGLGARRAEHAIGAAFDPLQSSATAQVALSAVHQTDSGNSERLITTFGDRIRYCPAWGQWLLWDGRRWAKDDVLGIEHLAGLALRSIHHEAAKATGEDSRKKLGRWALTSESAQRRRTAIECARSDPRIVVRPDQLDGDPWLFNCLNGTIDLHTGELREHRREDLITKLAPVQFDSDATFELWDRVLAEATEGNEEMQAFLARLAGYSLTGCTSEEKLPFVYGPEATSKSTILEALKNTWGDYGQTADFETFLKRNSVGNPRTDLARLAGARLVISIETEAGTRLADGFVKLITGGDRVVARKLYHDEFEFKPQFTLWWAANDAPKMSDRDGALWRRILEIPFVHQIPKERRDPSVKATLIDPAIAGPAVLAWAVNGCLEWQRKGLGVPPAVEKATEELRDEMNPLRDFFAERCVFELEVRTPSKTLYAAYRNWGAANNERNLLSRREFGLRIGDRLHGKPVHKRGGDAWQGIRLRDEAVEQSLALEDQ